jgi:hypothetical protein
VPDKRPDCKCHLLAEVKTFDFCIALAYQQLKIWYYDGKKLGANYGIGE